MLLRDKLVSEIKQLPISDLITIQNFLLVLSARQQTTLPTIVKEITHLDTRQALRHCRGNLAEDVIQNREDRF